MRWSERQPLHSEEHPTWLEPNQKRDRVRLYGEEALATLMMNTWMFHYLKIVKMNFLLLLPGSSLGLQVAASWWMWRPTFIWDFFLFSSHQFISVCMLAAQQEDPGFKSQLGSSYMESAWFIRPIKLWTTLVIIYTNASVRGFVKFAVIHTSTGEL